MNRREIIRFLKEGGIGVLATDTIYGLVGSAIDPEAVERIYRLRYRDTRKPMIILISSLADLSLFNVKLAEDERDFLFDLWPGKVSVVLPCPSSQFEYIHRGSKTLAFRLPKKEELIEILKQAGPLVAPSANPEGLEPARTISEAKNYFGDKVDFYSDAGIIEDLSSTLVAFENGKVVIKRQGEIVLE